MRRFQLLIKSCLDFGVALVFLLPAGIVIGLLAIILYSDSPGPVFFAQWRPGRGGRPFRIIKLRTMTPGDHTLRTSRNPDGSLALEASDSGLTRFGRWLRRTSLDELPQVINVLRGEMSFVGPRPDLFEHVPLYSEIEKTKLEMKPGLTGLAQVKGRNDLLWRERLQLDAWYVRNYSLWLDASIVLQTVVQVIRGKGVFQR